MTGPRVLVGISELEVARAPGTLGALGLGSCVAIIMHDPEAKIGGLAHVLLPSPGVGRRNQDAPGRYAPLAVEGLLQRMRAIGASTPMLTPTIEAVARRENSRAALPLDVKMDVAFAFGWACIICNASSRFRTGATDATGPKISS